MNTRLIKSRLRYSLELDVLKKNLGISVFVPTGMSLFYALRMGSHPESFWLLAAVMYGITALPALIFCTIRTIRIFAKPEHYIFCKGVLAQPHSGMVRDSMYYTVVLEDPENSRKFFVDTHAIFNARGGHPSLEEYTNKTVTIAYNRETEMVVVIG